MWNTRRCRRGNTPDIRFNLSLQRLRCKPFHERDERVYEYGFLFLHLAHLACRYRENVEGRRRLQCSGSRVANETTAILDGDIPTTPQIRSPLGTLSGLRDRTAISSSNSVLVHLLVHANHFHPRPTQILRTSLYLLQHAAMLRSLRTCVRKQSLERLDRRPPIPRTRSLEACKSAQLASVCCLPPQRCWAQHAMHRPNRSV